MNVSECLMAKTLPDSFQNRHDKMEIRNIRDGRARAVFFPARRRIGRGARTIFQSVMKKWK
jgi:hypothetical protein